MQRMCSISCLGDALPDHGAQNLRVGTLLQPDRNFDVVSGYQGHLGRLPLNPPHDRLAFIETDIATP